MKGFQLKSSSTKLSPNEDVRIDFIHDDRFIFTYALRSENSDSNVNIYLSAQQLKRLYMMLGLMVPGANCETGSL